MLEEGGEEPETAKVKAAADDISAARQEMTDNVGEMNHSDFFSSLSGPHVIRETGACRAAL